MVQPTLFLSHGAPDIALRTSHPSNRFLRGLGEKLERPDAILVVTAHWCTAEIALSSVTQYETIHDFGNFDSRLYAMHYTPPGDRGLASRIAQELTHAGMEIHTDTVRGLDHGSWIPLHLIYPDADIPVVQMSVQPHLSPDHHYRLGRQLALFREENVLIIGSGALTHNLARSTFTSVDKEPESWVTDFADWMRKQLEEGNSRTVLEYRSRAPYGAANHPSEEHLCPLFVETGAANGQPATLLPSGSMYGTVMMDSYGFGIDSPG